MNELLIKWEATLETGNMTVDKQHAKLFELVNDFASAKILKKEKEVLTKIFFDLEDYAKVHFAEEEELLSKRPGLPSKEHRVAHKQFIQFMHDLKFDYVSEEKAISDELFDFLVKWLKNHILVMDKKELGAC